jgi:hypothetical protein
MASIREALGVLPTKPVLIIVPLLIAAALGIHNYTLHRDCKQQTALRTLILEEIDLAAQSTEHRFVPIDVVPVPFDQMLVTRGFQPAGRMLECPFGWGLSGEERRALAREARLTLLQFQEAGQLRGFIELDSAKVRFDVGAEPIPAEEALNVERDGDGYVVTRQAPSP